MPGEGRIDVIKQPFAHHERFARAAFFPRATVEAQGARAAVLLQPFFGGNRRGESRCPEQVVPAAVTVAPRR